MSSPRGRREILLIINRENGKKKKTVKFDFIFTNKNAGTGAGRAEQQCSARRGVKNELSLLQIRDRARDARPRDATRRVRPLGVLGNPPSCQLSGATQPLNRRRRRIDRTAKPAHPSSATVSSRGINIPWTSPYIPPRSHFSYARQKQGNMTELQLEVRPYNSVAWRATISCCKRMRQVVFFSLSPILIPIPTPPTAPFLPTNVDQQWQRL